MQALKETPAIALEPSDRDAEPSPEERPSSPVLQAPAAVIGAIAGLADDGAPLVTWPGALSRTPYPALTQTPIDADMIGQACTLLFVGADPVQPLILGLLHDNRPQTAGYRVVQAEEALILQCGAARIELHDDGRILLQGMQIDSQAYGPYRIKGASVRVN